MLVVGSELSGTTAATSAAKTTARGMEAAAAASEVKQADGAPEAATTAAAAASAPGPHLTYTRWYQPAWLEAGRVPSTPVRTHLRPSAFSSPGPLVAFTEQRLLAPTDGRWICACCA